MLSGLFGTESSLQGLSAPDPGIDLCTLDHVRNAVGAANEAWVRHLSAESGDVLLQRFRAITAHRRDVLTAMSVEDCLSSLFRAKVAAPLRDSSQSGPRMHTRAAAAGSRT